MVKRMKTQNRIRTLTMALLLAVAWPLVAAPSSGIDRVLVKDGKLMAVRGGKTVPVTEEIKLSHGITVATNATYRVGQGRWHKLHEGQVLDRDGMLLSPNGSLRPVYDHVVMQGGKPMLQRDGELRPITSPLTLGDGSIVTPSGYHVKPGGPRIWLLDGEMLALDGSRIPVKDTIALLHGQVVVQKDGALIHLERWRTIMMNDGTKVFGDGRVVFRDGRQKRLREGEIITVQGVVRRLR